MSALSQLDGYWFHVQTLLRLFVPAWRRAHRDRLPSWRGCTKFTCAHARNECELLYSLMAQLDMDAWCSSPPIPGSSLQTWAATDPRTAINFTSHLTFPLEPPKAPPLNFWSSLKFCCGGTHAGRNGSGSRLTLLNPAFTTRRGTLRGLCSGSFYAWPCATKSLRNYHPPFTLRFRIIHNKALEARMTSAGQHLWGSSVGTFSSRMSAMHSVMSSTGQRAPE